MASIFDQIEWNNNTGTQPVTTEGQKASVFDQIQWDNDLDSPQQNDGEPDIQVGKTLKEGTKDVVRSMLQFGSAYHENIGEGKAKDIEATINPVNIPKASTAGALYGGGVTLDLPDTDEGSQPNIWDQMLAEKWLKPDGTLKRPNGFKGYVQDVIRMVPQITGQVGVTLVSGPAGGMAFMGTQIAGGQYSQLVKEGVEPLRAFKLSIANAVGQAALEQLGIGKALKFWKPGKAASKIFRSMAEAGGVEWLTELVQKYPELITNILAKGQGKKPGELLDEFIEGVGAATKEGAYEGAVAAPFGAILGGAGTAVSSKKDATVPQKTEPSQPSTPEQKEKLVQEVIKSATEQGMSFDELNAQYEQLEEGDELKPILGAAIEQLKKGSVNKDLIAQKAAVLESTPQLPAGQGFETVGEAQTPQEGINNVLSPAEIREQRRLEREPYIAQQAEGMPPALPAAQKPAEAITPKPNMEVAKEAETARQDDSVESEAENIPDLPPAVDAAAITLKNGTVVTGKTHGEVFDKLTAEQKKQIADADAFVADGKVVTREEAAELVGNKPDEMDAAEVVGKPIKETDATDQVTPESHDNIQDVTEQKTEEKPKAIGKAWVGNMWKPILESKEIKRGKNKGKFKVTLPQKTKAGNPKTKIVDADAVRLDERVEKAESDIKEINEKIEGEKPLYKDLEVEAVDKGKGKTEVKVDISKKQADALSPKEQKKYLLNEIDEAIDRHTRLGKDDATVYSFFVPGDGKYQIRGKGLAEFKKRAKKFPTTAFTKTGAITQSQNLRQIEKGFLKAVEKSDVSQIDIDDVRNYFEANDKRANKSTRVRGEIIAQRNQHRAEVYNWLLNENVSGDVKSHIKENWTTKAKIIDSIKNQKGESAIINDLSAYSADIVRKGYDSFNKFRNELKRQFGEVWDKIKHLVRKVFVEARRLAKDQSGQVTVWHGSPHKFDKFTTEKIGTGEGRQAFGWGLYFSDKKDIAKHYVKKTTSKNIYNATLFKDKNPSDYIFLDWYKLVPQKMINTALKNFKNSYQNEPITLKGWIEKYGIEEGKKIYLKKRKLVTAKQREEGVIQELVEDIMSNAVGEKLTGQQLYKKLNTIFDYDSKEASLALKRAGIDGIRYPTESLSGKGKKSDKFNYVVFDENAVTIEKIIDLVNNERGESEVINALTEYGANKIKEGYNSFAKFQKKLKSDLGSIWDKIKHLIRKVFTNARKIVENEKGEAEVPVGKAPKKADTDFIKSLRGKLEDKVEKVEKELTDTALDENIPKVIKAVGKSTKWAEQKPDTTTLQRWFSIPLHYFEKVPAMKRMYEVADKKPQDYFDTHHLIDGDGKGGSSNKTIAALRKQNKKEYDIISKEFDQKDINRIGHSVTYDKNTNLYTLFDKKGKKVDTFDDIDAAHGKGIVLEAQSYKDRGFSQLAVDTVLAVRRITHNCFALMTENVRRTIELYEKNGWELPETTVWQENEEGEKAKVTINLKEALAEMGDLRGSYMPRLRKPGQFRLIAKKEGENPRLELFDVALKNPPENFKNWKEVINYGTPLYRRARKLEKQGYTFSFDISNQLPEDVFEPARQVVEAQNIINNALETVSQKMKADEAALGYEEVSKRVAEIFAGHLAEQVANVFKARGFRKHMIGRSKATGKNVWLGYETDLLQRVGMYGKNIAAGDAKRKMASRLVRAFTGTEISWEEFKKSNPDKTYKDWLLLVKEKRVDPVKQKNAYKDGIKYMRELLRNDEAVDRVMGTLKGVAVIKYLGGRVSAPLINLTAMGTSVPATMSKIGGLKVGTAFKLIPKAMNDYRKFKFSEKDGLDKWTRKAFNDIERKGWHTAQYNREALSVLRSSLGQKYDKFVTVLMFGFGVSEQLNRASTIAATYEGIRRKHKGAWNQELHEAALEKGKKVSSFSHGDYGKVNRPYLARGGGFGGNVAQSFHVFKMFSHNYVLLLKKFGFSKETALLLAMPAVIGGVGSSVLPPIVFKALEILGLGGDDPEEKLYELVNKHLGGTAENITRFGLAGLGGWGVSLKGSLAIGVGDLPTDLKSILGAPGSIVEDFWLSGKNLSKGNVLKGLEKGLPLFAGNPIKAVREYSSGVTTKTNAPVFYGKEQLRNNALDAALRFLSFNPARIAKAKETQWKETTVEMKYRKMRSDIYAKFKKFYSMPAEKRTKDKYIDILRDVEEYNLRVKRLGLEKSGIANYITRRSIKSNIRRAFRPSKRERRRARRQRTAQ